MPRLAAALVSLVAVSLLIPSLADARLRWQACSTALGFECATLRVPLDRSGGTPGTIGIKVARETRTPKGGKVLLSLLGGPGQAAVNVAPFVEESMAPALVHHRMVVLDQRGTGGSGVLVCRKLQRIRLLNPYTGTLAGECGRELGPKRQFYATADSVADLDALRQELGVDKWAIQGTSYGTFVAEQYARTYPDHVERLVLDSNVSPDGVDAFIQDSWAALPRILREYCPPAQCQGITTDPVADMRELVTRMETQGVLRGSYVDPGGRRIRATLGSVGLSSILIAGDLNSHIRAAMPMAVRAALNGDPAPLLRMIPPAIGPPLGLRDLSFGLFSATTCADAVVPYQLGDPIEGRAPKIEEALNALPEEALGPFTRRLVDELSTARQCALWPPGRAVPPAAAPLPNVPALILNGRADIRTPIENAESAAAQMPRAQLITVPGTGHDTIDSDISGCVARAMFQFFSGRRIGRACARTSNAVPPAPLPPTALDQLPSHRGVPGDRGRVLRAVVGAINDVRETFYIRADGGLPPDRGGGLRGGTWRTRGQTGFQLRNIEWAPGVRVSGTITSQIGRYAGRVSVRAPNGLSGRLRLDRRRGIDGVLGGRRVHLPARAARGAVEPSLVNAIG